MMKDSGKMRMSRKLLSPRLVALLALPCFLGACTSWHPLRMSDLRDTMREYQPDRIQLLLPTESFPREIVLWNPQVSGDAPMDTIRGILRDVGQVGIPFSDVVGAYFPTKDWEIPAVVAIGVFAVPFIIGGGNN